MRKQTMRASANMFLVEAKKNGQKNIRERYFTTIGARMRVAELKGYGWTAAYRRLFDE